MYWFIRLLVLTDPASPRDAIEVKADTLNARTASRNGSDRRKFGGPRRGIVSLSAPPITSPVSSRMLGAQDAEALQALSVTYPEFGDAHAAGRVGHHFMVARSDALPKADAFELVVEGGPDDDPAPMEESGATWWLVGFDPFTLERSAVEAVIDRGPPRSSRISEHPSGR